MTGERLIPTLTLSVATAVLITGLCVLRVVQLDPTGAVRPGELLVAKEPLALYEARQVALATLSGHFASRRAWVQSEFGSTRLEAVHVVSSEFFAVVLEGRRPQLGSDSVASGVVLSDDAWRRWYRASPGVLGSRLRVNGSAVTVVGVAPSGFRGLDATNPAAVFMDVDSAGRAGLVPRGASARWLQVVMRRSRPEIEPPPAFSWLQMEEWLHQGAAARDLRSATALLGLLGGLTVLVACLSYALWLVAHSDRRMPEYAIRRLLGGRRAATVAVLYRAAFLPLGPALAMGILGSVWLVDGITGLATLGGLPAELKLAVRSGDVVLGAVTIAGLTALCSLPSLLRVAAMPEGRLIAIARRRTHEPHAMGLTRAVAASAQVGVAVTSVSLAVGASMIVYGQSHRHPGYEVPDRTLVISTRFSDDGRPSLADLQRARESVEQVAGVTHTSFALVAPLGGLHFVQEFRPERSDAIRLPYNLVDVGYFDTVGLQTKFGQVFSGALDEAVVNESAAHALGGSSVAVGSLLRAEDPPRVFRIVGVVSDSYYESLVRGNTPTVFLPSEGRETGNWSLVARASGADDLRAVAEALRRAGGLNQFELSTLDSRRSALLRVPRAFAVASLALAVVLSALAAVATWSILTSVVARQRRGLAIRLALGAPQSSLIVTPMRTLAPVLFAGLATGILGALAVARLDVSSVIGRGESLVSLTAAVVVAIGACCSIAVVLITWSRQTQIAVILREE